MRLSGPGKRSFEGVKPAGMGFILSLEEASRMLSEDPRNADVIQPYLVGEDINQRPDRTPARWIINFRDWPEQRARTYPVPFAHIEAVVLPERLRRNDARGREFWWRFLRTGTSCICDFGFDRCISLTRVSKVVQPVFVSTSQVIAESIAVFAYDDDGHFGLLSSGFHWWWAVTRASTMRTDIRYTPTDCFETFAQPVLTDGVGGFGGQLNSHRTALMIDRQEGLTKTYNRVHDSEEHADDIVRLRELHVALDYEVRDAYGWTDLELGHDFHDTKFGTRFTFAPVPRQEVLDRLLELNHERYAEEVRQGLHGNQKTKRNKAAPAGALTFDGV